MNEWVPLFRRLFVFTVPVQERYIGSTIYKMKSNDGFLSQAQPVWVLTPSHACKQVWKRGQKAWIHDGFEVDGTNLDLWEEHKNDPVFHSLKEFVEACGGKVLTSVISEGSILATED